MPLIPAGTMPSSERRAPDVDTDNPLTRGSGGNWGGGSLTMAMAPEPVAEAPLPEGWGGPDATLDAEMAALAVAPPSEYISDFGPRLEERQARARAPRGRGPAPAPYPDDAPFGVYPAGYGDVLAGRMDEALAADPSPERDSALDTVQAQTDAYLEYRRTLPGMATDIQRGQFDLAASRQRAAIESGADAAGAHESAAGLYAQKADDLAAYAREKLEHQQQFGVAYAGARKKYDEAREALKKRKIGPDQYWAKRGTVRNVLSVIGVMLGTLGASLSKSPNYALQIVNKAIDDDLDAQAANLASERASLGEQRGLLADMRRTFGDEETARDAAKAFMFRATEAKVRQQAGLMRGYAARARGERAGDSITQARELFEKGMIFDAATRAMKRRQLAAAAAAAPPPGSPKWVRLGKTDRGLISPDGYLFESKENKKKWENFVAARPRAIAEIDNLLRLDKEGALTGANRTAHKEGVYNLAQLVNRSIGDGSVIREGEMTLFRDLYGSGSEIFSAERMVGSSRAGLLQLRRRLSGLENVGPKGATAISARRTRPGKKGGIVREVLLGNQPTISATRPGTAQAGGPVRFRREGQ